MTVAVVTAALVAALGMVVWFWERPDMAPADSAATIAWSSPTAFLLKPVDGRVFSAVSVIGDSVLNDLLDGRDDDIPGGTQ